MSQSFFENHLVQQLEDPDRIVHYGRFESLGFSERLSLEEQKALFQVEFSVQSLILLFCISNALIIMASSVPLMKYTSSEPTFLLKE